MQEGARDCAGVPVAGAWIALPHELGPSRRIRIPEQVESTKEAELAGSADGSREARQAREAEIVDADGVEEAQV